MVKNLKKVIKLINNFIDINFDDLLVVKTKIYFDLVNVVISIKKIIGELENGK